MNTTKLIDKSASALVVRREISRFIEAAQERGEFDFDRRRRAQRRYHRSWPLMVTIQRGAAEESFCAALHNASPLGIAFLCSRPLPEGATVLLRLFWHDESCPLVPAIVRHASSTPHGCLIGCAFTVRDRTAERKTAWNN
ncbi:MAG: PilZ domain-containing protein [bacterium]|nr:PilZ domain-containing protein [bacterium]